MSVQEMYDRAAEQYDAMVARTQYIGPSWLNGQIEALGSASEEISQAVDLGCANGNLGVVLRERLPRARIVGVDVSPKMAAMARARSCYELVLTADVGDPLTFIPDATYDLAVALGVTEFVLEPRTLLREISRILRPSGRLLISFQEHWPHRPRDAPRTTHSGDVLHHAYAIDEVQDMLAASSFELASIESTTGYVSGAGFSCPYVLATARASRSGRTVPEEARGVAAEPELVRDGPLRGAQVK